MDETDKTCAICLETVEKNKNIATTECNHTFCLNCLIRWTKVSSVCPTCRTKLVEDEPLVPTNMTSISVSISDINIHSSNMVAGITTEELPPNWPYC